VKILLFFIRLILAAVFIYAGVIKFMTPDVFLADIEGYRLLPYSLAWALAFYLPPFEIVCGMLLLCPSIWHRSAAAALLLLMTVFLLVVLSAWMRGLDISCGCFGKSEVQTNYLGIMVRDLIILGGLVGVLRFRRHVGPLKAIGSMMVMLCMTCLMTFATERELVPGTVVQLQFPELGKMHDGLEAGCEIRIPDNYSDTEPVSLLVWFGGGKGSHRIQRVPEIVDFRNFLVVALPYPGGDIPRLAVTDDTIDQFWNFQQPMLESIKATVPNISEEVRIAGGFSSGAHLVGAGLDSQWAGFVDYFNIFILHEGGTSKFMRYDGINEQHTVLISYGNETPHRGFQEYLVERMIQTNRNITVLEIPETRHELNGDVTQNLRGWIDQILGE